MFDIVFFCISLLVCVVIMYIVAVLWFSNERDRQLKVFMLVGLLTCLWTFFSAMTIIVIPEYFTFVYVLHSVAGGAFTFCMLLYALYSCNSRLVESAAVRWIIIGAGTLDVLAIATNPWHRMLIAEYNYPEMPMGPLFWVHALLAYAAALAALITFFRYVFRFARKTPLLVMAAFSTLLPYILNVLLALNVLGTRRDLTSVSFFITFALFFLASYRSGLFNFKTMAMTSIFTSLADIMIIVNSRGVIVDINTAFRKNFADFSPEVGKTTMLEFTEWLSGRVTACQPENLLSGFSEGEGLHEAGEFSLPCAGAGGEKSTNTFTLRREQIRKNKNLSGYVISMSDVSAYRAMIDEINTQNEHLVELKELAEQASRAKSSFLASMSHEIRTPINAITGMAAIARGTDDLPKIRGCLDNVDAASRQLLGLINDILDMSKIEAGKMELASEPFDLHAAVLNVKSIVGIRAAEKRQSLELHIADGVPRAAVGDDMRLSQILINLLSNAVKFTPDGGTIELSVRLLGTEASVHNLEITVRDNGIGISEEQQKRLFGSFEQADTGISKRFGGSGLGLAISKSMAELMGGDITLESQLGKGSCFTVRVYLREGSPDMLAIADENQSYDFGSRTALLVEDIAINREIVVSLLENYIRVECAENGREAVDLFTENPYRYDIIFMDVHMPIMDGYAATEIIRASGLPNARTVPILAMTANAFSEDVAGCRAAGMDDHIAKPVDINLLLRKISQLLSRRDSFHRDG